MKKFLSMVALVAMCAAPAVYAENNASCGVKACKCGTACQCESKKACKCKAPKKIKAEANTTK